MSVIRPIRRLARRGLARRAAFTLLLLAVAAVPAAAQDLTTGSIRGRVTSAEGAPVAGAQVSVTSPATGLVRNATASDAGQFAVLRLPPGRYALRVQRLGFRPFAADSLDVRLGEATTLNVALQAAAAVLEAVEVTAGAGALEVDTRQAGVAEYVSEREIRSLPALGRDFTDFIALSGLVSPQPEVSTGGTVAIGGGRSSGVNVQIDGADANFNFFGESRGGARIPFTFSLESIREFQLITNGYDVEFGNYSSGVVNVVTRGGTNDFRGTALAYVRDDQLTRSGFAEPGDELRRPAEFEVQQYALNLSGPIVRDRLHYLVSLDGQRRRDPFETGSALGTGVSQPVIDRFTSALEGTYGLDEASNEFGRFTKTDDNQVLFGRLDWTLAEGSSFSLRANYADYTSENDGLQFGGSNPRTFGSVFSDENLSVVAELNTAAGGVYNVARIQFAEEQRPRVSNNFLPRIRIFDVEESDDLFYGGSGITFRNDLRETKLQLIDNVTLARGAHTLKFGTNNVLSQIFNEFWLFGNGDFEFDSLEDFEARRPSRFSRNVPLSGPEAPSTLFRTNEFSVYAQDEWQATDRLVATVGLRYDYTKYGDDFGAVPEVDALLAGAGSSFRTGNSPEDADNVSPRLSLAYDVFGDGDHVLRAGAGLFFGRVPGVLGSNVGIGDEPYVFYDCRGAAIPAPDFASFGSRGENIPASCAGGGTAGGAREYAFWAEDFEYPETYKFNVGYEARLLAGTRVGLDVLYGRTSKNFTVTDLSLPTSPAASLAAEDGRAVYVPLAGYDPSRAAAAGARSRFANISRIYVNDNQGVADEFATTVRLDQRVGPALLRASYTYNRARDNASFTCCTNNEGLFGDPTAGDLNDKGGRGGSEWSNTRFVRPHTVVVSGVAELPFAIDLSGIFRANSGTFYTPSVGGDLNADGNSGNDRPFVGRAEDMLFETPEDRATYERLLAGNECLAEAVGTIIARNTCQNPWFYQFDLSLRKGLAIGGDRELELVADFFNVLNGLNREWGQLRTVTQSRLLSADGFDAASGKVRYTVNDRFGEERFIGPVRQFQTQLGLRLLF